MIRLLIEAKELVAACDGQEEPFQHIDSDSG